MNKFLITIRLFKSTSIEFVIDLSNTCYVVLSALALAKIAEMFSDLC